MKDYSPGLDPRSSLFIIFGIKRARILKSRKHVDRRSLSQLSNAIRIKSIGCLQLQISLKQLTLLLQLFRDIFCNLSSLISSFNSYIGEHVEFRLRAGECVPIVLFLIIFAYFIFFTLLFICFIWYVENFQIFVQVQLSFRISFVCFVFFFESIHMFMI